MKTQLFAACCALAIAGSAYAADNSMQGNAAAKTGAPMAAPGGMDMSKMGPASRKVTKEDKKGVEELYKSMEAAWQKGDVNAVADNCDFPIVMVTDDSSGKAMATIADRDTFMKMMGGMANMPHDKTMKMSGKQTPHFLSDTLAWVDEDNSMTMGKMKASWHAGSMVTKVGDKWKLKQMAEAGWGDMAKMGEGAGQAGGAMQNGAMAPATK